ncbi:urea ABC transporter substrate-binding protein [Methylotuvimicrobium sp. KM2]|uniref:urea ABC transporter substrate-binding protein n=1 Tax=Methylotuvimicrobium sp. KM2 TaxID=3133976 RepID=UPI00310145BD
MHKILTILLRISVAVLLIALLTIRATPPGPEPIRIGVIYSLTGTMSVSEAPLIDAISLAVDEINNEGGLLGRLVEMKVVDGQSDWQVFFHEAERLITQEKVDALFACWTSACRKAVKPVVERFDHLLFYPVQYEGLEQSPNIVYTGSAPNQQIVPGTHWALEHFGSRVYLVGSDYIFPHTANIIIRDLITAIDGQVLAERYVPLGQQDVAAVVRDIRQQRPDVVLNTLNGDTNKAFFAGLLTAGLADIPLMSFSVSEGEMQAWRGDKFKRHFTVSSYFQSVDRPQNKRFVNAFGARFGKDRLIGDAMEAAYVSVKLWAQAVRDAGSAEAARVNRTILRQTVNGPSAITSVDLSTRHTWKMVRIGQVMPGGQFEQVFATEKPLRPKSWPYYRTREQWFEVLESVSSNVKAGASQGLQVDDAFEDQSLQHKDSQ